MTFFDISGNKLLTESDRNDNNFLSLEVNKQPENNNIQDQVTSSR